MRFTVLLLLVSSPGFAQNFESCVPENSYLEGALSSPLPNYTGLVPKVCILRSQARFPRVGVYGFCPNGQGRPGRTFPRPCLSVSYVSAVHQALNDVAECLGADPRTSFVMFNLESGHHINAVGGGGDSGISQLVGISITDVNQSVFAEGLRQTQASTRPACQRILPYFEQHSGDPNVRCSFITVPGNPVRNVIYGILLKKRMRRIIDTYFARYQIQLPPQLNENRVRELLSLLAYNGGPAGVVATFRAYLASHSYISNSDLNFTSRSAQGFPAFLALNFPGSGSVRKRVSKYLRVAIRSAFAVEAGLEPGTCMNLDLFAPLITQDEIDSLTAESSDEFESLDTIRNMRAVIENWVIEDLYSTMNTQSFATCKALRDHAELMYLVRGEKWSTLPAPVRFVVDQACARL